MAKKDVPISYSGSDSMGNYTKIHIDTSDIKEPEDVWGLFDVINLKIEYWPEDATMDAMPKPLTESLAEDLIQKANVKQASALSKDLKKVVDKENNDHTLISCGEDSYLTNIAIKINEIDLADSNDSAKVVFHFTYYDENGNIIESFLGDDEFMCIAELVYEDGKWKVDDIGWDLVYAHFHYYPGDSYKRYHNRYK